MSWLGSYGGCATHDPIPNSIVKPSCADDTLAYAQGKVGRCQACSSHCLWYFSIAFIKVICVAELDFVTHCFFVYFQNVGWVKTLAFRRTLQYNGRHDI